MSSGSPAGSRSSKPRTPLHGGVLIVDKPSGPTSHDVVRLARRAYHTRAVGHAGTLDPLATGVLIIGVGEATKLLHHLSGTDKTYLATIALGTATDSLDAQGQVVERAEVPAGLTLATVADAARSFLGEQLQRVPAVSAVKQGGVPLYVRVRRGEDVSAPERSVVVHGLQVLRVEGDAIDVRVHCSKGFYVRALARDLARALGSVGHIRQLRRSASGQFGLDDACACDVLQAAAAGSVAAPALIPPAAALRGQPCATLNAQGLIEVSHGRSLLLPHIHEPALPASGSEPVALVDEQGLLRALGRAERERIVVVRGVLS